MIGYEKRDQRGFLTEFLAWSDSPMCAESWCKFHIKILITSGVMTIFMHSGGYTFLSINLYGPGLLGFAYKCYSNELVMS